MSNVIKIIKNDDYRYYQATGCCLYRIITVDENSEPTTEAVFDVDRLYFVQLFGRSTGRKHDH